MEPLKVNNAPVVNAVKLPDMPGMPPHQYMVLCFRGGIHPYWVVWHVGWYDAEWVATSGDFFSDPIKAVQCLKTRAADWGA